MNKTQFPPYFGFGKLRPETIVENENKITADYYFLEKPVHRIGVHTGKKKKYFITDIFEGNGRSSKSGNLEKLGVIHFKNYDSKTCPIFHYFFQQVYEPHETLFEELAPLGSSPGMRSFHPDGIRLLLRLILFNENNEAATWQPFYEEISKNGFSELQAKALDSYPSVMMVDVADDLQKNYPMHIFEFSVALAYVNDLIDRIRTCQQQQAKPFFRLHIDDISCKETQIVKGFPGFIEHDNTFYYQPYLLCFKRSEVDPNEYFEFVSRMAEEKANKKKLK